MKLEATTLWQQVQESAIFLSKQLKETSGEREKRKAARALLKEAFALEQRLTSSEEICQSDIDAVQELGKRIDAAIRSLHKPAEEDFLRALSKRYKGPVYDIGQRIRAPYMVLWGLHADRLSRLFLARSLWFWERSERAQNGITSLGKAKPEEDEKSQAQARESFELIWRKKRR